MAPIVAALTGTPGTGKTTVGALLRQRGFEVVDLGKLIEAKGLHDGVDEARGSKEVNPATLSRFLQSALAEARQKRADLVLEGHLAHHVRGVEVAVVLRCHPRVLAERLAARGWSPEKIRENCEAEALDALTIEATEEVARVLELDATTKPAAEVAAEVEALLRGRDPEAWTAHRAGTISWGDEVLSWS